MPSIEENRELWETFNWADHGESWSQPWGGSPYQWWGAVYPRVHEFLPTGTLLEIAPGTGRWTRFLVHLCDRLIGVDLVEKCVEGSRLRFAEHPHASFHQNDGKSLEVVADSSVDFAFSFDALVHAERDVINSYLRELARTLAPDGVGFIHHSNVGRYVVPATGRLPFRNIGARGRSMTAPAFQEMCQGAGLLCVGQEVVNWRMEHLNDCFSLITLPGSRFARPNVVVENPRFMDEAAALRAVADHYGSRAFRGLEPTRPPKVEPATTAERELVTPQRR